MEDLQSLLAESARHHDHLCPRQILGVRLGLRGLRWLDLEPNRGSKRLLLISETDGCFLDGLIAATGCAVGHRTLRIEDYGKTSATFVDTKTGQAIRVAPTRDIRQRSFAFMQGELDHYLGQLRAYQIMPDDEMFTVQPVTLNVPLEEIVSQPGMRAICSLCGEEIMNEREIRQAGLTLCQTCARGGYYTTITGQNMQT